MREKHSKQIVYRYNGDPKSDEAELDLDGETLVPQRGQIIERNGKNWKVVQVNTETTVSVPKAIPVVRLFLTDQV